jgi:hypothetical protein
MVMLFYSKSKAIANEVTVQGKTIEQYPPPIAYTPKNATRDNKKEIQCFVVDFFAVISIFFICANIKRELYLCAFR